ncbi:MAG TPA: DUF3147 family protein [Pseudolabrys sp.]|nr:DUF3147 family protein [Pseudolabrys sp.]
MLVRIKLSALGETRWYECLIRFVLGGVATVLAGVIAKMYGPVIGGLFLAFPAVFPASATLIESHERKRKERAGLRRTVRGKDAAALDSAGAALGSIGLAAFAAVAWLTLPHATWWPLLAATIVWLLVSVLCWYVRRLLRSTR